MKAATLLTLTTAILAAGMLHAQTPADPLIEPVAAAGQEQLPSIPEATGTSPEVPAPTGDLVAAGTDFPATDIPSPPPPAPAPATAEQGGTAPAAPFGPLEQQKQEMKKSIIKKRATYAQATLTEDRKSVV